MGAVLTRDGLLAALALRTEDVALPSGQLVRVRTLKASERIAISTAAVGEEGKVDSVAYSTKAVAACLVDEAGNRLLSDEDAALLADGSSDVFEFLFRAVQRINGLGSTEAAKGN